MDVGDNLGHHDSEVEAEMDIGYDDPYTELGAEKDIGYDDPSAEEGAEKDAQDGQRPSLESAEKISEIDAASTSVHQEPNLQGNIFHILTHLFCLFHMRAVTY